jgi:hypothetical protein
MSRRFQTSNSAHLQNNTVISKATLDYMKETSVAYQREQGNVYSVTMEEHTATTSSSNQFVLFNPVGTGKIVYLYETTFSKEAGQNTSVSIVMSGITDYLGGSFTPIITNMKLKPAGSPVLPNDGSVVHSVKGELISSSSQKPINKINLVESGASSYHNYIESMIEIPSGCGIILTTKTNNHDVKYSVNMKWIEKDALIESVQAPIPAPTPAPGFGGPVIR